jgi:hypothetical protein
MNKAFSSCAPQKFGAERKSSFTDFRESNDDFVPSKVLKVLLTKRLGSCSVLVKNSYDMIFLMRSASELGLEIDIIAKDRVLKGFIITAHSVRIINSENYFLLSTRELNTLYKVYPRDHFFPRCHPSQLSCSTKIPGLFVISCCCMLVLEEVSNQCKAGYLHFETVSWLSFRLAIVVGI